MKKILGLDLGTTSIGWALIIATDDELKKPQEILGIGVRIIPLTTNEKDEFTKGNAISKNRDRTLKRTQRKGLDRYQLRRQALINCLERNNMMPDKDMLLHLSPLEIWGMRAKAVREKIQLQELGRVLLHLNQKRGYKHSKSEQTDDEKKQTDYVTAVNNRYDFIRSKQITIGELFYKGLKNYEALQKEWPEIAEEPVFRSKEKVFPRAAYEAEFDQIWAMQSKFHNKLTHELYDEVRNEIIYYQRELKSQKELVSICEFEKRTYITAEGKEVEGGPKVAPRSSPLAQMCKLWESINNISVKNRTGEEFTITQAHRMKIFDFLQNNDKLIQSDLFKILGIGKNEGFFTHAQIARKGLQGNTTRVALAEIIGEKHQALKFDLATESIINRLSGEITDGKQISATFEKEPLYQFWHIIYSLKDHEEDCKRKLKEAFGFDDIVLKKLAAIDFSKGGFGNKSAKAIRKILPYLQEGAKYSDACAFAGYNHSGSLTVEENLKRQLEDLLQPIKKNTLRQPVVEKILNQMINLVNALIEKHGKPDEIRVELARELKQSKEERNTAYKNINKVEQEKKNIIKTLLEDSDFKRKRVSQRDIDRYRLWQEFGCVSPYEPTKTISLGELYSGNYDIEHIIPKALRFDDSFSNKTICPRKYNSGESGKNNLTAFDYMSIRRSKQDFEDYLAFIEKAYKDKKVSKTKYENLLATADKLREGFIDRQLRETQYISRKAREILSKICRHVHSTSGTITQRLRDIWGWDEVLEQLNLPKYRALGMTYEIEVEQGGIARKLERISEWSKRDDHRHHAIDALAIACTSQGLIQRINTLNKKYTRDEMFEAIKNVSGQYYDRLTTLDKYLLHLKPFNTAEVAQKASEIIISFKPGKKVASYSRRLVKHGGKKEKVQTNIIEPRGPLSEESVYGKINKKEIFTLKLDKNFKSAHRIIDPVKKELVLKRLAEFKNDPDKAFTNLKKNPIWIDKPGGASLTEVEIFSFTEAFVIKYPLSGLTVKDIEWVVDEGVKKILQERIEEYKDKPKEAFKDLEKNPVWLNKNKRIPIKTVRCFTGIKKDSVAAIKVKDSSWGIEYEKYVKPGSNHHIAIYKDGNGKLVEHVVTFWHATERKRFGLPVIIKKPAKVWDDIAQRELTERFLEQLPEYDLTYVTSLQQNESFVFNMTEEELQNTIDNKNFSLIGKNLFRVRKITSGAYWFNHQFETEPRESVSDKKAGRCIQASVSSMKGIKVNINTTGEIFIAEAHPAIVRDVL